MFIILLLFLLGSRRPCPTSVKPDYFTIKFVLYVVKRFILQLNGGYIISLLFFAGFFAHNAHKRSPISK
jgi:hypothetical protein